MTESENIETYRIYYKLETEFRSNNRNRKYTNGEGKKGTQGTD